MEYLVTMTTHIPDGTSEEAVADVRAREAAHTRELAAQGHILRLLRPPLAPGEWRTLGLFAAADHGELEVPVRGFVYDVSTGRLSEVFPDSATVTGQ
jgi:muconolactone D-isomerase